MSQTQVFSTWDDFTNLPVASQFACISLLELLYHLLASLQLVRPQIRCVAALVLCAEDDYAVLSAHRGIDYESPI